MNTVEDVVASVESSRDLWEEMKRRWYDLKLPGYPGSPGELMVQLLLAKLNINSIEQLQAARDSVSEQFINELKTAGILPPYWSSISDPAAMTMLTLLADTFPLERSASAAIAESAPAYAAAPVYAPESVAEVAHTNGAAGTDDVAAVEEEAPEEAETDTSCVHTDGQGRCVQCTDEETATCDSCNEDIIAAKGVVCQDADCDKIFCPGACAESGLSEHDFCEDHETVACSACGDIIDRGTENVCANVETETCKGDEDYCDNCAKSLLNEQDLCPDCSGEERITCPDCDADWTESKLTKCANYENCGRAFCAEHSEGEFDEKGFCQDCEPEEESSDSES